MRRSDRGVTRLTTLTLLSVLTATALVHSQSSATAPQISRREREALNAIIKAIDVGTGIETPGESAWPVHVLRASDGSHYLAFSLEIADRPPQATVPQVLYVRLSTRTASGAAPVVERSAVAEWLAGQTPAPPLGKRGVAFGEMPTYGAGAIATRGPGPQQSLQILEMERERNRERKEADEARKRATLEGTSDERRVRPLLPFEDFDTKAMVVDSPGGSPMIRRSVTTGPGDYDLIVGWADPAARTVATTVRVMRRRVTLAPASTTELALSSVVLAENVAVRDVPRTPAEQTQYPYSIGTLEISPARDNRLTSDERLAFVVQIVNPQALPNGKPDVSVTFRVLRRNQTREEVVGSLAPQTFNAVTLPADFDVLKRHPLFAAVGVPLQSFRRGDYRLEIAAHDRVAGAGTLTDATFTVVATPAALLREAPPLSRAFERADLVREDVLAELLARLSPTRPSAAFTEALSMAGSGRFAELIRDDQVSPDEVGARQLLRSVALFAIGERPVTLAAPTLLAIERGGSPAVGRLLLGALRAAENQHQEAIAEWEQARTAGFSAQVVGRLIADTHLRMGRPADALALLGAPAMGGDARTLEQMAAAAIAAGRFAEGLATADRVLTQAPDNLDAQWLALHAAFAVWVNRTADRDAAARVTSLAARYTAANGRHSALAGDWAAAVRPSQ